jgi:hypothetical protein
MVDSRLSERMIRIRGKRVELCEVEGERNLQTESAGDIDGFASGVPAWKRPRWVSFRPTDRELRIVFMGE